MHPITGFYFFTKGDRQFVAYSTLYKSGRFASMHECTGMTEAQARGAFVADHSRQVDLMMAQKKTQETKSKIILA